MHEKIEKEFKCKNCEQDFIFTCCKFITPKFCSKLCIDLYNKDTKSVENSIILQKKQIEELQKQISKQERILKILKDE